VEREDVPAGLDYESPRPKPRHESALPSVLSLIISIVGALPVLGVYAWRLSAYYENDNFGPIPYVLTSTLMGAAGIAAAIYPTVYCRRKRWMAILALALGAGTTILCFRFWIKEGLIQL
jgi:hypothetical protein